jgi:hypothetical protein
MDKTFRNANLIIKTFFIDQEAKLANGYRLRKKMHEDIARGEPRGYRARWILETSTSIFSVLGEKAKEFNARHEGDVISVDDMLDVLETSISKIKSSS